MSAHHDDHDPSKLAQPDSSSYSLHESVSQRGDVETSILPEGSLDPVYQAKAQVLNEAMQEIGMGRYQVRAKCLMYAQSQSR
jgi:hypothetical protein